MSNLSSCIRFKKNYTKIVHPIITKRVSEYKGYSNRIKTHPIKVNAVKSLNKNKFDLAVSSVLTLYPNVKAPLATEVIFSFQAIVQYLTTICEHSSYITEPFLKLVFSSLKDALNLRTDTYENYFMFFPSKDDDGYLTILVEKCRQKVRLLPSFNIIRDYLSTYLSLFIDLQVTKYSTDYTGKEIDLLNWSSAHRKNYPDISNWEFCMAIDSSLTLQLLLALATNPDLTEQELENIINDFFPWICGIQKILEGYINYNESHFSRNINHIFCYTNLKEYEDRIIYFIGKASENKDYHFKNYHSIIRTLLSIYVTHPKANTGMNKITSKVLLKSGGHGMLLLSTTVKLLRAKKLI